MGILRFTRTIMLSTTFLTPVTDGLLDGDEGASFLLDGEASGFSIDATSYDTVTPAVYIGGPVGGTVSVGTSGTFASDNVALDSSILTQAGTSPKLVHFNSAPYVRWTPHNLLTQSQTFDHSDWVNVASTETANTTVAPDGTTTADTLIASGAGTERRTRQNVTTVASFPYCLSIYAKAGVEDWIFLELTDESANAFGKHFDLTNGAAGTTSTAGTGALIASGIESVGSGWYRLYVAGTTTSTANKFNVKIAQADNDTTVADLDSIILWGAQLNRGYSPTPYLVTTTVRYGIPQSYDAYEDCFGVLVEPAATNLALRSEEFGNAEWVATSLSVSSNTSDTTAPDGSSTAEKLTATAAAASHQLIGTAGVGNVACAVSIYAKAGTSSYIILGTTQGSTTWFSATFDLSNGIVTDSNVGAGATYTSSSITAVGNGWYRCSVMGTPGAATAYTKILFSDTATPTQTGFADYSWTAAGTETIYIWGAQLETGSVATSYIPTLGSTVTRAKDQVAVATASIPSLSSVSVYYGAKWFGHDGGAGSCFIAIRDAPSTDRILNYFNIGDTNIRFLVQDGGATQATYTADFAALTDTRFLEAFSVATNSMNYAQGGSVATRDVSGTMPTGMTTLEIGFADSTYNANMMLYYLGVLPREMDDTELSLMSTP